jgi:predicted 2-oxoglutarate/Fe(II)-dependent dioxygenase YbiX
LVSEYDGAEKAFWTKHQSVNWISNANQRKLCATVILSDGKEYEGGDFIMYFGSSKEQPSPNDIRTKGTLIIYPAFRFTQVMPVLAGKKYHLDLYWEGPYWR